MVARIFLVGGTTVGAIGTGLGIGYGLLVCLLARLYGYPLDPKVYLIGELPVQIPPERDRRRRGGDAGDLLPGDALPVAARQPPRRRRRPALHLEPRLPSFARRDVAELLLRSRRSGLPISSASYFDGHLAMMPSGTTSSWLSAVERPLGDDLGAALNVSGTRPV